MKVKLCAEQIFRQVLDSVNPVSGIPSLLDWNPMQRNVHIRNASIPLPDDRALFVTGFGKASASMAAGLEAVFGDRIRGGMVITTPDPLHRPEKIELAFGSHPYPDESSLSATRRLIKTLHEIPDNSLVLNLLSGGTSSLLCRPVNGIRTGEIRELFQLLVTSGMAIDEINAVRKACSAVKGGQLLKYYDHVDLVNLIISDVPGDRFEDIGSGPTIPQTISYRKATRILKEHRLWDNLPASIRNHLEQRPAGSPDYTPAVKPPRLNVMVSSARTVARKAAELCREQGYDTWCAETPWSGPIGDFKEHIISSIRKHAEDKSPKALIFFGECTVSVSGNGKGGRNQELALLMARELKDLERPVTFLSGGTDGIDGPTDAAGAVVNQTTWKQAEKKGIDPAGHLNNNDSYHFFEQAGGHIKTGPTGNNVMDLQIAILD